MMPATMIDPASEPAEALLHGKLARGDGRLGAAAPILRQLLVSEDQTLLSDEVVARVRGMLTDLAGQLLAAQAEAGRIAEPEVFVAEREDGLAERLADEPALLAHVHALAIEARLALQLQASSNVDAVLSPLLHDLSASGDYAVAGSAVAVLAAQARFIQHHRRMVLPLGELPGDLLHAALLALRAEAGQEDAAAIAAERQLRDGFDESRGRLGLISRLVMRLGDTAHALDVVHAGPAIFATALAKASRQERDQTVLSFTDGQSVRLALAMCAAGLEPAQVEAQFFHLHPTVTLPEGLAGIGDERAAMLLAASAPRDF